ncbi:hypothetical protein [Desulfatitalea alkaliphila]|uniref:Uncharacterized protein n=1 Tax=Desulfatitalea alkaliphila TaxID=2929485 RepID=A0AA41QZ42_9BACT|nr:hypothetical protein [Desulfatitalea alkaliphila]MCJ8498994.1 hypothetical protein [Desulfatitalea alkaliphila]
MRLFKWLPWNYLVQVAARRYGVINPLDILAKMRSFAQPSEIAEPIELLRAGILFHARGLINTRAIQHNLDWIWPFWVEKQFNPNDQSFIPRAFSFSHVNLTHRNWTSVGHPDLAVYPIIDPRGLVTPIPDGWSLDFWIISPEGKSLFPSQADHADQQLEMDDELTVTTTCGITGNRITSRTRLLTTPYRPVLEILLEVETGPGGWLVVALRPYNPEGIQFIENVDHIKDASAWRVNKKTLVLFSKTPENVVFSNYQNGDVVHHLKHCGDQARIACRVGMATAAAVFPVSTQGRQSLEIHVPLATEMTPARYSAIVQSGRNWENVTGAKAQLSIPDQQIQFLYQAAMRTLLLLSSNEVVPGPYTYNRFWFRDACFMLHALLVSGFTDRAAKLLGTFPAKQKMSGYFQSQEGEWDSNGQVLWIMWRFFELTGRPLPESWLKPILRGADWIEKKRLLKHPSDRHHGLLPAGFSAEHFGPNDYYFWDDFWGLAGFNAAARLAGHYGDEDHRQKYMRYAADFDKAIASSINRIPDHMSKGGLPASPYRRMDAGAIGSLVADYPLQLAKKGDRRILNTVEFLMRNCFHEGAFFQDMIHSGINAYLTLSLAQTLLRNDDARYEDLIRTIADLASPTGQWPEAIHPRTRGGCMGDGQHGWAAAEWIMMIRNLFVREEDQHLILGSGIFPEWMAAGQSISYGPSPTPYGDVSLSIDCEKPKPVLTLDASWRNQRPDIIIQVPGYRARKTADRTESYELERQ